MKRRHLPDICLLPIVVLLLSCQVTFTQEKVFRGWSQFTTDGGKIIDLSETAKQECAESIKEKTANTSVEIKYQPQFAPEAKEFLQALRQIVEKTQEILSPLPVDGIRFYLLQMPNPPQSYKVLLPKQDELFIFGKVFETKKQIEMNCITNWDFCNNIYVTLAHEITHPTLKDHVVDARWFEEGLGNYVGFEVARQLSPSLIPYQRDLAIKSSLNNPDFQQELFGWGDNNGAFWQSKNSQNRLINNSKQETYDTAQQFVTAVIEESKKKGIVKPLQVLLDGLQKFREQNGKSATTQDILALIETKLHVDSRLLSTLSEHERKNLVTEASTSLLQTKTDNSGLRLQKRFYSILVLMNIEEIALSEECLDYLLKLAFDERESGMRYYPASVLVQRINQSNFDASLQRFRQSTPNLKKISLNNLKKALKKNALNITKK